MDIITTIEYCLLVMIVFYLIGLTVVWVYELKRNALYRSMKEQVRYMESFPLSMALLHAKTYKIMEDYHRNAFYLERVQQFILKNVLLIGSVQHLSPLFTLKSNRRQ